MPTVIMPDGTEVIVEPICLSCIHSWGWDWGFCDAFPVAGIPEEILHGTFDHRNPWPRSERYPYGDHDIQYKEIGG